MEKTLSQGWRRYEPKIYGVLHIAILVLSLFLVVTISVDTFRNLSFLNQESYMTIQLWVCLFFLFDFLLELALAPRKWRYLKTRFIFFLVSIPYLNLITWLHLDVPPQTGYFLRFIPLVRSGYALAIVVGWFAHNRASSLLVSYLTLLMASVYFSSLLFFVMEHDLNPMVTRYGDALWWAFMDVTTVGSNIYAVTVAGKVLSVVLAALGMMMFPIFTVYVTHLVQQAARRKSRP